MSTEDSKLVAVRVTEDEINALIRLIPKGSLARTLEADDLNKLPPEARVALKITAAAICQPGECMVCGCTQEEACPGGCSWVNPNFTLCSVCLEAM
ncbi:MAG TPA: hypothetical protein VGM54_10065 [Chthoniobacter sp.]